MNSDIKINFVPREKQKSEYDWANISIESTRVGKARCLIDNNKLIIYSIQVYDEYKGHGYGKYFVEEAKKHFGILVADRVRFTAIGFWEKMGFIDNHDGNYIYTAK